MFGQDRNTSTGRRLVFPVIAGLTLLISMVLLFSSRSDVGSTGKAQTRIIDTLVVPLTLFSLPLRGGEKALRHARERKTAFLDNQKLKTKISELSDVKMRADMLALKIKRYEEMLEADPGIDIPFQRIPARLVAESDGPFARSALLNIGSKSGVKTGYAVMTEDGLYGHVIAVGRRSSRVLLVQDINSRIAVLTPRTEARAIMIGTNRAWPMLSFIDDTLDWREGDIVLTSGDEGVLPQGLPIGVVRKTQDRQLHVELYSDRSIRDWVYVFSFSPVLPPEEDAAETTEGANEEGQAQEQAALNGSEANSESGAGDN